jgi:hypothetical protein
MYNGFFRFVVSYSMITSIVELLRAASRNWEGEARQGAYNYASASSQGKNKPNADALCFAPRYRHD